MNLVNLDTLAQAELREQPYPYTILHNFINPNFKHELIQNFPMIDQGGSFTLNSVKFQGRFAELMQELDSPQLRDMIAKKFNIDLSNRPPLITLRGYSRARDGQIHTDTKSKLITVLLYFNPEWDHPGGKIRVLYDGENMDSYAAEMPPLFGNCLIFKVTDNCWHGFAPYEGIRRSIQLNYVLSSGTIFKQQLKHNLAALVKKVRKKLTG